MLAQRAEGHGFNTCYSMRLTQPVTTWCCKMSRINGGTNDSANSGIGGRLAWLPYSKIWLVLNLLSSVTTPSCDPTVNLSNKTNIFIGCIICGLQEGGFFVHRLSWNSTHVKLVLFV